MTIIKKIWGTRNRIFESAEVEMDLLNLNKNTVCSIHNHKEKINRFILISGEVNIITDLGKYELKVDVPFDVEPPMIHQFTVIKDSIMLEIAFVNDGTIDSDDIKRIQQGGKIINGEFCVLDKLSKKQKYNQ